MEQTNTRRFPRRTRLIFVPAVLLLLIGCFLLPQGLLAWHRQRLMGRVYSAEAEKLTLERADSTVAKLRAVSDSYVIASSELDESALAQIRSRLGEELDVLAQLGVLDAAAAAWIKNESWERKSVCADVYYFDYDSGKTIRAYALQLENEDSFVLDYETGKILRMDLHSAAEQLLTALFERIGAYSEQDEHPVERQLRAWAEYFGLTATDLDLLPPEAFYDTGLMSGKIKHDGLELTLGLCRLRDSEGDTVLFCLDCRSWPLHLSWVSK